MYFSPFAQQEPRSDFETRTRPRCILVESMDNYSHHAREDQCLHRKAQLWRDVVLLFLFVSKVLKSVNIRDHGHDAWWA
jgi:hypothetical protein